MYKKMDMALFLSSIVNLTLRLFRILCNIFYSFPYFFNGSINIENMMPSEHLNEVQRLSILNNLEVLFSNGNQEKFILGQG